MINLFYCVTKVVQSFFIEHVSSTLPSTVSVHTTIIFPTSTVDPTTNLLVSTSALHEENTEFPSTVLSSASSTYAPSEGEKRVTYYIIEPLKTMHL